MGTNTALPHIFTKGASPHSPGISLNCIKPYIHNIDITNRISLYICYFSSLYSNSLSSEKKTIGSTLPGAFFCSDSDGFKKGKKKQKIS